MGHRQVRNLIATLYACTYLHHLRRGTETGKKKEANVISGGSGK